MEIDSTTTALITGASGGLGHAIARALGAAGAQLVLAGRRRGELEALARETKARVIVADLARREGIERCLAEAGAVDVFVANAGVPSNGPLSEASVDDIDRVLDVNLRAPMVMAHHLAPGMAARGRGHLVFMGSVSGKVVSPGTALYSASKFGLRGFALALREDLRGTGVGVTLLTVGFVRDAGMFADAGVTLPAGAGTRSPEDVAAAVLRAVHTNPAEITVAAPDQAAGALLGAVSPSLIATLQRWLGAEKVARALSEAQRHKR